MPGLAAPSNTGGTLETIATPTLWAISIAAVLALMALDFVITRKPHEVSMKEAISWSLFYMAVPLAFGVWVWTQHGSTTGVEFYTGFLVEKSLSVDNLFVFMLLLTAFAVPKELQQRVLLFGIIGALVLRGIFIALGAQLISSFSWTFLIFGLILIATAVKVFRDAMDHSAHVVEPKDMKIVQLVRKFVEVTPTYEGTRMSVRRAGTFMLTPLALVTIAILLTDVMFAIDAVPAVYGITNDPYLVFATNAFALLGLRALYFVLAGALSKLVHLGYGLSIILAFIGVKLMLHWAHGVWPSVPTVPTLMSLGVIVSVLTTVVITSLIATRGKGSGDKRDANVDGSGGDGAGGDGSGEGLADNTSR